MEILSPCAGETFDSIRTTTSEEAKKRCALVADTLYIDGGPCARLNASKNIGIT